MFFTGDQALEEAKRVGVFEVKNSKRLKRSRSDFTDEIKEDDDDDAAPLRQVEERLKNGRVRHSVEREARDILGRVVESERVAISDVKAQAQKFKMISAEETTRREQS